MSGYRVEASIIIISRPRVMAIARVLRVDVAVSRTDVYCYPQSASGGAAFEYTAVKAAVHVEAAVGTRSRPFIARPAE